MTGRKIKIIKRVCVIMGVCLIASALFILLVWQQTIRTSENRTKEYVNAIFESISSPQGAFAEERRDNTMPTLSVDGTDFVGILEMPRHSSVLPICAQWGAVFKYPCCFSGSIYDRTMKIGGTSQKGQYDFYRDISVGDSVFFTDMEGNRYQYTVNSINYSDNADRAALEKENSSLTLFIKNIYAFEYIIIHCNEPG